MKEKDFQTKLGKWLINSEDSHKVKPAVYELKLEKGKSFAFDKVSDDQIKSLLSVKSTGLYHKINDLPVYYGSKTRFASKKPFDCFFIQDVPAYVVIGFYTPRKKIEACFIEIEDFVKLKEIELEQFNKKSSKKEIIISASSYVFEI